MGDCGDCKFLTYDGEFGTIQSCARDDVTQSDEGIEVEDINYPWGKCPAWEDYGEMPVVPF